MKKGILVLKDGTVFEGESCGAEGETAGEVVFNTSVTGYREIITNPSAKGQIINMAYPETGGYGVNDDAESGTAHAAGFVTRHITKISSSWRSKGHLPEYLKKNNVIALEGIDTRALLKHIMKKGEMPGIISTKTTSIKALLSKLKKPDRGRNTGAVQAVSTKKEYEWNSKKKVEGLKIFDKEKQYLKITDNKKQFKVAVVDCGVKTGILRMAASCNFKIIVVPAETKAERLIGMGCSGIIISNGPGDPRNADYVAAEIKKAAGKIPVLGIGLGCQLLAMALGGRIYRMKAGHRGGNHSVKNLRTVAVEVVAQNHGYAVDAASLKGTKAKVTHINLNDNTVEGIEAAGLKAFGVQYYPLPRPGAHDAPYVFNKFIRNMEAESRRPKAENRK